MHLKLASHSAGANPEPSLHLDVTKPTNPSLVFVGPKKRSHCAPGLPARLRAEGAHSDTENGARLAIVVAIPSRILGLATTLRDFDSGTWSGGQ